MLDNPTIIIVVIPMGIAVVAAAIARAAGHGSAAPHIVSLGGVAGFLVAYVMLVGWPDAMPRTATQKLGYITLAGLVAGVALDLVRPSLRVVFLLPAAAAAWIVAPQLIRYAGDSSRGVADWASPLVIIILGFAVLWHLTKLESGLRDGRLAQLIAAFLGLGGVCLMGSAASLGMLSFAAAAAGAGIALWNLGRRRAAVSAGLVLGLGAGFAGLAVQTALFTSATPVALLLLLVCFLTDSLPALRPMATTAAGYRIVPCVPPYIVAAIAVGIALLAGGGSGY